MSGIGGLFYRNSQSCASDQLKAMGTALSHRGPDGISFHQSEDINLIHCSLRDTPESFFESLPHETPDKQFIITWHGRLDNRKSLQENTGWKRPLATTTDSDLILAAYKKWDKNCVDHLLGDFAFAIWNNAEKKLFCARDHMGVKPFYYCLTEQLFAFSSELSGLLALSINTGGINENRIADYLTCVVTENTSTFYNDFFRLPPGHSIEITKFNSQIYKYWQPQATQLNCTSDREFTEQFYSIFKEAIRCRLRSAFPVGSFLSGGIDSSSIVAMTSGPLQHHLPEALHTFSGVFNTISRCDERNYFQALIDQNDLTHHAVLADQIDPSQAYDHAITTESEPFWAPHFFMGWELMALAKKHGIRTLLDGHDGDSAISHGTGLLPELLMGGHWIRLIKECHAITETPSIKRTLYNFYRVCRNCITYNTSSLIPVAYQRNHFLHTLSFLNPSFITRNEIENRLLTAEANKADIGQREYERHIRLLTNPLQPLVLEFSERQCMQHKLIGSYPFFDKRLIEFCLALPSEQKRRNGYNRFILRKSLTPLLPDRITKRKSKTDFSPNMTHTFSTMGKQWLQLNIDKLSEQSYNYVSKVEIHRIYNLFIENPSTICFKDLGFLLRSISLSQWIQNNN